MSQSYLKMNKDHAAELEAELMNLRAENERLQRELIATDASWVNAELREAELKSLCDK